MNLSRAGSMPWMGMPLILLDCRTLLGLEKSYQGGGCRVGLVTEYGFVGWGTSAFRLSVVDVAGVYSLASVCTVVTWVSSFCQMDLVGIGSELITPEWGEGTGWILIHCQRHHLSNSIYCTMSNREVSLCTNSNAEPERAANSEPNSEQPFQPERLYPPTLLPQQQPLPHFPSLTPSTNLLTISSLNVF
jgi:hypothetical protein